MTVSCLMIFDLAAGDGLALREVATERFGVAFTEVAGAEAEAGCAGFFRDLETLGLSATSFNR